MKPQCKDTLEYMEMTGSISSLEAIHDLGITRLSAVIFDLKKQGYKIATKTMCGINRKGKPTHYARYFLER